MESREIRCKLRKLSYSMFDGNAIFNQQFLFIGRRYISH